MGLLPTESSDWLAWRQPRVVSGLFMRETVEYCSDTDALLIPTAAGVHSAPRMIRFFHFIVQEHSIHPLITSPTYRRLLGTVRQGSPVLAQRARLAFDSAEPPQPREIRLPKPAGLP